MCTPQGRWFWLGVVALLAFRPLGSFAGRSLPPRRRLDDGGGPPLPEPPAAATAAAATDGERSPTAEAPAQLAACRTLIDALLADCAVSLDRVAMIYGRGSDTPPTGAQQVDSQLALHVAGLPPNKRAAAAPVPAGLGLGAWAGTAHCTLYTAHSCPAHPAYPYPCRCCASAAAFSGSGCLCAPDVFAALHEALRTELGNAELEWVNGAGRILNAACGTTKPHECGAGTAGRR